jgi:hypothetical protein
MDRTWLAYGLALAAGLCIWTVTAMLGHRIEPWDDPAYWSVGYPAAVVVSGVLGFFFPEQAWRWGAALVFSQAIVMTARGAGFSLLPMGLILLGILSLPPAGAAMLAAWLRRRV